MAGIATSQREVSPRQVSNAATMKATLPPKGPVELDSHADTCCADLTLLS
jgi:hypothetical protein